MKYYIGIDLGGTNVRVAVVDENGLVIEESIRPSLAKEGPKQVIDNIAMMIDSLDETSKCSAIGMGIPGPVDTDKGCVTLSTNLNGFSGYPLVKEMEMRFNLPVYIDNDANVAGLAEALLGAGQGYKSIYYLTHSTGIGGAFINDGKVISGRKGYAGEIGNIIVDRTKPNQPQLNTLIAGAVENEASGMAMVRIAQGTIDPEIVSALEVFELAQENHKLAVKIIESMSYDFAQLLATIAAVTDPHAFVIGGGVSKSRDLYWEAVKKNFKLMVHSEMADVEFLPASLLEPGIIGAAMLCRSKEIK